MVKALADLSPVLVSARSHFCHRSHCKLGCIKRNISALLGCTALIASVAAAPAVAADWPMFGASLSNLASNPSEQILSKNTVAGLAPKWVATVGGDVSARAAVVDGIAYFPDWAGNLWALNTATGKPVWQHTMTGYGLPAGTVSRTTPAVDGNIIYFGTQQGAYLVAIDKSTGALRWVSQMDTHPLAIITASPAVKDGVIYTGVASNEEGAAANPSYTCCSFRGSVLAADARTGKILWKTLYRAGRLFGRRRVGQQHGGRCRTAGSLHRHWR
jgi:polyvinyl alcohol dehydrogenase (cytochrome)